MKQPKTTELTDEYMLRQLVKQANGFGAKLRVLRSKKPEYDFFVSGKDYLERQIKMAGTATWLYDEVMKHLVKNIEAQQKRQPKL